jgi:peroxiredoxin Q/BCP
VVLGVSFDPVEKNRDFARKYDFPFALLSDTDRAIGMAYHAASSPDQESAKRISYWIGPEGKIVKAYDQVTARSHPAEVLADIET